MGKTDSKKRSKESIGTNAEPSTAEKGTIQPSKVPKKLLNKDNNSTIAIATSSSTTTTTTSTVASVATVLTSNQEDDMEELHDVSQRSLATLPQNPLSQTMPELSQTQTMPVNIENQERFFRQQLAQFGKLIEKKEKVSSELKRADNSIFNWGLQFVSNVFEQTLNGNISNESITIGKIATSIHGQVYHPRMHAYDAFWFSTKEDNATDSVCDANLPVTQPESQPVIELEDSAQKEVQEEVFTYIRSLQNRNDVNSKKELEVLRRRCWSIQQDVQPSDQYGWRTSVTYARFFTVLFLCIHKSPIKYGIRPEASSLAQFQSTSDELRRRIERYYGPGMFVLENYSLSTKFKTFVRALKRNSDMKEDLFLAAVWELVKTNQDDDENENDELLIGATSDDNSMDLDHTELLKHFLIGTYFTYALDSQDKFSSQIKCLILEKDAEMIHFYIDKWSQKFQADSETPMTSKPIEFEHLIKAFSNQAKFENAFRFAFSISPNFLSWACEVDRKNNVIKTCGACCLRAVYMILTNGSKDVNLNVPEEKEKFIQFFKTGYIENEVFKKSDRRSFFLLKNLLEAVENREDENVGISKGLWGDEQLAAALLQYAVNTVPCVFVAGMARLPNKDTTNEDTTILRHDSLSVFPAHWDGDEDKSMYPSATDFSLDRAEIILKGGLRILCLTAEHFTVCQGEEAYNQMFPGLNPETFFELLAGPLLQYKDHKVCEILLV